MARPGRQEIKREGQMVRKTYRPVKRGRATDVAPKPASGTNLGGARLATWT
jgi:hypothetical protein